MISTGVFSGGFGHVPRSACPLSGIVAEYSASFRPRCASAPKTALCNHQCACLSPFHYLAVAVITAPIVVSLAVLRFGTDSFSL